MTKTYDTTSKSEENKPLIPSTEIFDASVMINQMETLLLCVEHNKYYFNMKFINLTIKY